MTFANKRIAIVGGGLGGMAFLNSALFAGLSNITLYEQASQFTEVGAGVDITRNANQILDAYGLKEKMLWKSSRNPVSFMEYRDFKTANYLGQIDEFGDPPSRQIHRADLLDVLKERVPQSMLKLAKRLAYIEQQIEGPAYKLFFEDGSTAEADIVIGCDGIKSKVRQYMGIADDPNYSGQVVYRGYALYEDLPPKTAEMLRRVINFRGHKKHILNLPIGNDESNSARVGVIGFMTEPLEEWRSESWLARAPIDDFEAHVADWAPEVQDIIAALRKRSPDGQMLKQVLYVRDPTPKWFELHKERPDCGVVLVGDSVHSTLPHQGQGTCMAIESGVTLAVILKNWNTSDLESALQFYQDIRKPRTDRITKTSQEAGKLASADNIEMTTTTFNPEALHDRMKWVMEFNALDEVFRRGAEHPEFGLTEEPRLEANL